MSIYYLGAFPPDYGGVTIKNLNLFTALCEQTQIKKVDFNLIKRKNMKEFLHLVRVLFNPHNCFVIGVAGKGTRKRLTRVLYYLNPRAMNRSIIMIMGGTAAQDIASDQEYRKCAAGYKKVYVETAGMEKTLLNAGLRNAAIFPNGRFRPRRVISVQQNQENRLRCLFFSQVSRQKGVDLLLEAAKMLPEVQFDIYGTVVPEYNEEFQKSVQSIRNAQYCGVFKSNGDSVYALMNPYDVMLFPTKWRIEGVPGVLVEAKIAGLAVIASDKSYNAELVRDGMEGMILRENTAECLAEAISELDRDRELLQKLKCGSQISAERFYIENYIDEIVEQMR